jgi:hypothetical protein
MCVFFFNLLLALCTFLRVIHHTWSMPNNPYSFIRFFLFLHSLCKVKAFIKRISIKVNIFPFSLHSHIHIYSVQLSTNRKLYIHIDLSWYLKIEICNYTIMISSILFFFLRLCFLFDIYIVIKKEREKKMNFVLKNLPTSYSTTVHNTIQSKDEY